MDGSVTGTGRVQLRGTDEARAPSLWVPRDHAVPRYVPIQGNASHHTKPDIRHNRQVWKASSVPSSTRPRLRSPLFLGSMGFTAHHEPPQFGPKPG